MKVIKRDGTEEIFDKNKIVSAVKKAFDSIDKDDDTDVAMRIAESIESMGVTLTVEEIQNIVESKLMASKHKDVAKAYINYRYLHKMARDQYSELMSAVADKLTAKNIQNQNANVDEASFGGRIGEASTVVTKQYALEYLVSDMAKNNHINNMIYIHDLDSYAVGSHNCLSIPFDDLLAKGFNTRQTDVRPANSVNTAFQLVAVIFQLQSLQQFGGVSATHLDWTMVPYVRKSFYKHFRDGIKYVEQSTNYETLDDEQIKSTSILDDYYKSHVGAYNYAMDMTVKEIHQAVEGMYHNLNTLGRLNSNVKNIAI